jgi:uncharacterized protein YybS (DUF2232 family)
MAMQLVMVLVSTILFLGIAGLAVAWALLKGLKPRTAIAAGTAVLLLYMASDLLLDISNQKKDLAATIQYSFDEMWKMESRAMAENKIPQAQIEQEKKNTEKFYLLFFPALSAISCLFIGFMAYYAVSAFLSRVTSRVPRPIPFRDWMVPDFLVFGLIAGGILKVLAGDNRWAEIIGDNLLVFFLSLYALEGLSIISFFFHKWRLSGAFRFITYAAILSYMVYYREAVVLAISAIGVLDIWVNFRKWKTPPLEQAP